MIASRKVVALMDDPSQLDRKNFVYPELLANGFICGEEVEEAIIEYLEKRGFSRDALQSNGEWQFMEADGSYHTTKLLKIKLA
jgi:hypothetical protein